MRPPAGFYVHSKGTPSKGDEVPSVPGPALPVVAVLPVRGNEPSFEPHADFIVVGFMQGSFGRLKGSDARFCAGPGCKFCAANGQQPPDGFEL